MTWQEKILEKIKIIKCLKRERGSILVLTALLLPILFGCLGIAYDVGTLYMHKARLQNVTDAAALAGGRAYLQSQKKDNNNDKDTYDPYTNGNITDEEYVIGGSKTRVRRRPGEDIPDDDNIHTFHLDADNAADVYIYNNIINLGNKVYSDKFSHYALPGYKKRGDDYVNADEIFYRIGLYEYVPLYFLSVITNKYTEKVRAGSVVVVKPETTTTTIIPGSGSGSSTVKNPSIFDNLFTYSDYFAVEPIYEHAGNGGVEIEAGYSGNIVFTYGNKSENIYYSSHDQGNNTSSFYNHLYEHNGGERIYNTEDGRFDEINDPIIDTFFKTTDYVDALKMNLNKVHVEYVNSQNLNFTNDDLKITKYVINVSGHAGSYVYCEDDYYPFDENTGDYLFVQDSNNNKYVVCYHKSTTYWQYLRCAKKIGDTDKTRYYMLDTNGNITSTYLTTNNNSEVWTGSQNNLYERLDQNAFNNAQQQTITNFTSNVIHVHNGYYGRVPNLTIKVHDNMPGNSASPLYVIVESNVGMCKIEGSNNDIPVIILYLGTGQMTLDLGNGIFKGTIYAPNTTIPIQNYNGTFYGNIVAKSITSTGNNKGTWIQQNFLENYNNYTDEYVAEVTRTMVDNIQNATKLPNNIKSIIYSEYADVLGIDQNEMQGDSWYSKQTYDNKQKLYRKWKELRERYPDYANQLWPWNEHFNIESGEDQTIITTTPEILRLINYRTDYQPEETIQENDVLDPYIYETLGQPNSYGL